MQYDNLKYVKTEEKTIQVITEFQLRDSKHTEFEETNRGRYSIKGTSIGRKIQELLMK